MNNHFQAKSSSGPKACTTCAKAKSRCNPGPTEETCERCHRLKKPCSAQTPAPPRKRKAPKPTRVAELEKRLEDLTARVESQQPGSSEPTNGESTAESEGPARKIRRFSFPDFRAACRRPGYTHIFAPDNPDYHDQYREQASGHQGQASPHSYESNSTREDLTTQQTAADSTPDDNHLLPCATTKQTQRPRGSVNLDSSSFSVASNASRTDSVPQQKIPSRQSSKDAQCQQSLWLADTSLGPGPSGPRDPWFYPSPDEAHQFLEDFNNHLVSLFPFVVIPPNATSEALRRDRPLLWKAIMMQGLHMYARRQVSMGDELLQNIVTEAFIQSRKSFDVLQALEVLLAWFHMSTKSFQLTNLLFLMRSICVSLGFNESQEFSKQQDHTVANLEQMRAFTGVYYLVTMVFTTNKKPDAFMNTTYLDHCCRILEERMEYPTDQLVVLLVRTQQLSQSISMTLAFRNNKDSLPLSLLVQSFQHEIRQLRCTVPENLGDCVALKTQMHIAEILLYEAGLSEDLSGGVAPTDRLELLWECLNATRSMLEARFAAPHDGRPRTIVLASFDYTYAMLVCLRLSLLQLPGWDLRLVRKELSFDDYLMIQIVDLQQFTSRRRDASAINGGRDSTERAPETSDFFEDPYVHLHTRLAQLRVRIRAELSASLPPESQQPKDISESPPEAIVVDGAVAPPGSDMVTPFGEPGFNDAMQGLDDPFWQDWYKFTEWETNLSVCLGWDSHDTVGPVYASWATNVLSS